MPNLVSSVTLALAASVSPVMLSEQAVLLSGPRGHRTALSYAAGTITVVVAVVTAVLVLGRRLELPTAPHLSASLDLVIGAGLLGVAALIRWRPRRNRPRRHTGLTPGAAYGFGLFSMATNFTTLALVVPAAKQVSSGTADLPATVLTAALIVTLVCLPAWGPVALTAAAPTTAAWVLDRLQEQIERHGALVLQLILLAAGFYLLVRGLLELLRP